MDPVALAALRRSYALAGLDTADVDPDPVVQFNRWLMDAVAAEIKEPNALVLATADAAGHPRARMLLLKAADSWGFTFFTNYSSTKGRQLSENPNASMCFPWFDLERQVVVEGSVERLTHDESAAYFATRPYGSQIGAWASKQSTVIDSREVLAKDFDELSRRFPEGSDVPLPDFWGGFRLNPTSIEFWQGRSNRLHDRVRYRHSDGSSDWLIERLSP
jgi:pyridoxamine 5'-phosphate oxidase